VKTNSTKAIKTPSQTGIILGLTKYALKASLKNRAAFFFTLAFPLIFISVFGLLGNGDSSIKLGVTNEVDHSNPIYTALETLSSQEDSPVQLVPGTAAELEKKLSQDKVASILAPSDASPAELTLIGSNGSPQGKAASENLLRGLTSQMNLASTGITKLPFTFDTKEISGKTYNYIDFALPGQIGFSLLSLATFGVAFMMITLRKTLVLKRMFATAVKPFSFVLSQALSRSVQAVLQTVVLLLVGVWAFHFTLANGWVSGLEMIILSLFGVLAFLGFGILISNLADSEETLPIALNIFNLPQMLLAGVFFPIDGMPQWVQAIGNNLPLAYLNIAMRKISIEGLNLIDVWPYLAGLFGWAIVSYILAAKTFRTE
jgi:ABC-2 type transport system permease protein